MAVTLQIQDGSPWWLSPNVWAVPGADPEGPPGTPIVDTPACLWAHVENLGATPVSDAQVRSIGPIPRWASTARARTSWAPPT